MNRCDSCCARALETWLSQNSGRMVRLCAHYSRQHQLALYNQGFRLYEVETVPAQSTIAQHA